MGEEMVELTIKLDETKIENLKKNYHTNNIQDIIDKVIDEANKKSIYDSIMELQGFAKWEGDLSEMREDRYDFN